MLTQDQLVHVAERTILLPAVPGRLEALAIPGVEGHYVPDVPGVFVNRVGGARLDAGNALRTIEAVQAHFAQYRRRFAWFVASSDTPDDLEQYLAQAGFAYLPEWDMSAMALTDLDQEFPTNPQVRVMRAGHDDRRMLSRLYQAVFHLSEPSADLFADLIDAPTMAHYLVYLDGVAEPVGATSMFYIPEYAAVVLEAAVILEPYQGRGIYKSMLAQRIHDARADGMQAAVVQAKDTTSAPALRKYGFVKQSEIRMWMSPEQP